MTAGVLFIENYIAGGADRVARALLEQLPFSRLTVMVNRSDDTRILVGAALPSHVRLEYYDLVTIPDLIRAARSCRVKMVRPLLRLAERVLRYPLFAFSIAYFRFRIVRTGASVFLANNGGYPAGAYCRSATIAACTIPGIRVFHLVHSLALQARGTFAPFEWLVDRLLDRSCRLITVCRAAASRLNEVRWIRQEAVVIYSGLPDRGLRGVARASQVFRILHVGYFDGIKNQAILIKAASELVRRGLDVQVCFVGPDPERGLQPDCRRLAAELGVERHVVFEDFIDDVEQCYADADLFVLCSRHEGLPISVLEAMRAGKAVVATDVGGVSEQVIDGVSGYLVPVDDHVALADRIEELMRDRELLARFGVAGRRAFEAKFSAERMIAEYSRLLGLVTQDARDAGIKREGASAT